MLVNVNPSHDQGPRADELDSRKPGSLNRAKRPGPPNSNEDKHASSTTSRPKSFDQELAQEAAKSSETDRRELQERELQNDDLNNEQPSKKSSNLKKEPTTDQPVSGDSPGQLAPSDQDIPRFICGLSGCNDPDNPAPPLVEASDTGSTVTGTDSVKLTGNQGFTTAFNLPVEQGAEKSEIGLVQPANSSDLKNVSSSAIPTSLTSGPVPNADPAPIAGEPNSESLSPKNLLALPESASTTPSGDAPTNEVTSEKAQLASLTRSQKTTTPFSNANSTPAEPPISSKSENATGTETATPLPDGASLATASATPLAKEITSTIEPEAIRQSSPQSQPRPVVNEDAGDVGESDSSDLGSTLSADRRAESETPTSSHPDSESDLPFAPSSDTTSKRVVPEFSSLASATTTEPSAEVTPQNSLIAESTTRLATETWARQSLIKPAIETSRAVMQQVTDTLVEEISTYADAGSKKITLKLNPVELGKLTLHLVWENESVKAQIIANEFATSELLSRDRGLLIDTLQANGLDFESFEVRYGGADPNQSDREPHRASHSGAESEQDDPEPRPHHLTDGSHGSVVNLIA